MREQGHFRLCGQKMFVGGRVFENETRKMSIFLANWGTKECMKASLGDYFTYLWHQKVSTRSLVRNRENNSKGRGIGK